MTQAHSAVPGPWWAQVRLSKPDTEVYEYTERPEPDGDAFFDTDADGRRWCEQALTELAERHDDRKALSGHVMAGQWLAGEFVEDTPTRQWIGRWDSLEEAWVWVFDGPDGLGVRP